MTSFIWLLALTIASACFPTEMTTVTIRPVASIQTPSAGVDATGNAPTAVISTQIGGIQQPQAVPQTTQPAAGLYLNPQTLAELMWCVALGYCPDPGTELPWNLR